MESRFPVNILCDDFDDDEETYPLSIPNPYPPTPQDSAFSTPEDARLHSSTRPTGSREDRHEESRKGHRRHRISNQLAALHHWDAHPTERHTERHTKRRSRDAAPSYGEIVKAPYARYQRTGPQFRYAHEDDNNVPAADLSVGDRMDNRSIPGQLDYLSEADPTMNNDIVRMRKRPYADTEPTSWVDTPPIPSTEEDFVVEYSPFIEAHPRATPTGMNHESYLSSVYPGLSSITEEYFKQPGITRETGWTDRSVTRLSQPSREMKQGSVRQVRQIGIVRAEITLLSLSEHYHPGHVDEVTSDDTSSASSGSEWYDSEDPSHDTRTGKALEEPSHELLPQNNEDTSPPHRRITTKAYGGRRGQENEGSDDDDDRPLIRKSKPYCKEKLARFACPYQAHELFRSCLKPGRHNPEGGCDGIRRLKQHLCRKHMVSFRCQRCWKSFDSRRKAKDHQEQQAQCDNKEKPPTEVFMSGDNEKELSRLNHAGGMEEDTWWSWFKLLIPNMQSCDVASLKNEYYPCLAHKIRDYVRLDPLFMIPALTFPNVSFPPFSNPPLNSIMRDGAGSLGNESESLLLPPPEASETTMPNPELSTQTLPLLEVFDNGNGMTNPDSSSTGLGSTNNTSLTPASSAPVSHQSPIGRDSAAQRSYDRLRTRYSRLEAANTGLRKTNNESQAKIGCVEEILEDVLASDDLPVHLYEKILQAAESLTEIKESLR
ncbi:hypothetical protein HD806DRAFT_545260 [Xylariaceae sp. AK1471]|nr:hypothetical protein HD806DRAFT_545260 [Xylariaceae sp. AK1471]